MQYSISAPRVTGSVPWRHNDHAILLKVTSQEVRALLTKHSVARIYTLQETNILNQRHDAWRNSSERQETV